MLMMLYVMHPQQKKPTLCTLRPRSCWRWLGFNLRKFASNVFYLNHRVAQGETIYQFAGETFTQVTLGDKHRIQKKLKVKWKVSFDQLSYSFNTILRATVNFKPTKRNILWGSFMTLLVTCHLWLINSRCSFKLRLVGMKDFVTPLAESGIKL